MNRTVRNHSKEEHAASYQGNSISELAIGRGLGRNRIKLLPWLAGAIFIFGLLYCSSYIALLWLPPYARMDMKSLLVADYSSWAVLEFQPVDPMVIEEIKQERGLPEQMVVDGEYSSTPASTFTLSTQSTPTGTPTPQATASTIATSPSALPPTGTSATIPTTIVTTPQPAATSIPAATHKPHRTPKPHHTPKPK